MGNFALGEAVLGTGVDMAGLGKGLEDAKGRAKGAFSDMGNGLQTAFSVAGGFIIANVLGALTSAFGQFFSFVGGGIEKASNMNETISKVGVVFGDAADQVLAFADTADTALGQSRQSALDAAATFAIFGKSAGLSGTDLVNFSTRLTGLASDMASFNNTSPEQAIQAIGAALRGETEPIRAYGVLLDDASMRQKAFELGIISSTKDALTPAQKVLAAQALILAQTTLAQGDFARTSQGAANQQRIFAAQVDNLQTRMGEALYPAMQAVYEIANSFLIPALGGLVDNVLPGLVTWVGGAAENFKAFAGELSGVVSNSLKLFEGDAVGAAANVLYWLDQFVPGAADAGDALLSVADFVTHNWPLMQSTVQTVFAAIESVGLVVSNFVTGTLLPALATIWQETGLQMPTMQQVFESVMTAIANGATLAAAWINGTLVPALTVAVNWVVANWPTIQATIETVVAAIGTAFINAVAWVNGTLIPAFNTAVAWVTTNWPVVQATVETVMNAIGLVVNTVLTAVSAWWAEHGAAVLTIANAAWSTIVAGVTGYINTMQATIATVVGVVQALWATWGDTLTALATNAWTAIQAVITTAATIIQNDIDAFAAALTGDWTTFGEELRANWDAVWGLIGTLAATGAANLLLVVSGLVANIIAAITGTDWGAVGSGIVGGIAAGISNGASAIVSAATSAAKAALDAAKGFLGIHSPSTVFAEVGANVMAGMEQGITANADGPQAAVQTASAGLLEPVARMDSGNGPVGRGGSLTVNVDARGSTLSREEIERIVRDVLNQHLGQQNAALRLGEI